MPVGISCKAPGCADVFIHIEHVRCELVGYGRPTAVPEIATSALPPRNDGVLFQLYHDQIQEAAETV